jgi:hypothetical protein
MSDAKATAAKAKKSSAGGGGRSAATGVKIGKGAARAIGKNAECVDEVLDIFDSARKATVPWTPLQITQSFEMAALQLGRVTRATGCGRLEVTLQDGTTGVSVPIAGTIKFKGRAGTKGDRANCMGVGDIIIVRGGLASAKVSTGAASLLKREFERYGIRVPGGFFVSATEAAVAGAGAADDGYEFDRAEEVAAETKELAEIREAAARSYALRHGKAASGSGSGSDSSSEDLDIDAV